MDDEMQNRLVNLSNQEVIDGFELMLKCEEQNYRENKIDLFDMQLLDVYANMMIQRGLMSLRNVVIFVGQTMDIDLSQDKILLEINKSV